VVFVGFVNVPLIAVTPLTWVIPPVNPPVTEGGFHVNVVPDGMIPFTPLVGVTVKPVPLQVMEVIALITAVGFTVTVTVKVDPVQLPDNGVTVDVAVCVVLVGFVNNPLILTAVVPLTPPVIPPVTPGAPQLYVVPTGMIPFVPFVGLTVKLTPLHVVFVIAVNRGAAEPVGIGLVYCDTHRY